MQFEGFLQILTFYLLGNIQRWPPDRILAMKPHNMFDLWGELKASFDLRPGFPKGNCKLRSFCCDLIFACYNDREKQILPLVVAFYVKVLDVSE